MSDMVCEANEVSDRLIQQAAHDGGRQHPDTVAGRFVELVTVTPDEPLVLTGDGKGRGAMRQRDGPVKLSQYFGQVCSVSKVYRF